MKDLMNINVARIFLVIILSSWISRSYGVVILVHGSFATLSTWCKPTGLFYQELEKQAHEFNQKVISFSWSGMPHDSQIVLGAQALAKTILSYSADEEIILIGHSHGGNVINFASQLLHNSLDDMVASTPYTTMSSIISQAYQSLLLENQTNSTAHDYTPTTKKQNLNNKNQANNHVFKVVLHAMSCVESYKLRHAANNQGKKSKKFIIEKVYLLGTPVHTAKYMPHMKIVNKVFNFYSLGDFIQPVFGLYKRTYPPHERITNISLTINNTGTFLRPNKPKHHELHEPIVGQWILAIPEKLQTQKLGNFENFSFNKNSSISFSQNQAPAYKIHGKKKSLQIF